MLTTVEKLTRKQQEDLYGQKAMFESARENYNKTLKQVKSDVKSNATPRPGMYVSSVNVTDDGHAVLRWYESVAGNAGNEEDDCSEEEGG